MKTDKSEILNNRDASTGLTRFFLDLAIQSLEQPNAIPSLDDAPRIERDYRKVSFEGIKCAGKDYTIDLLLKQRPDLILKPKFKKIFPFRFLENLRSGGMFGGVTDTLLLASVYAFDEEFYVGKGKVCYIQNRGVYTFATMEIMRLNVKTQLSPEKVQDFIVEIISVIGIPDIGIYLDVDLETAIKRSKERTLEKSSKQVMEGDFLEEQIALQVEYNKLLMKFSQNFHRISSSDAQKNVDYIVGLIDAKTV